MNHFGLLGASMRHRTGSIGSESSSMKITFKTYSQWTLSHRSALFHNSSGHSVEYLFEGGVKGIMSASTLDHIICRVHHVCNR